MNLICCSRRNKAKATLQLSFQSCEKSSYIVVESCCFFPFSSGPFKLSLWESEHSCFPWISDKQSRSSSTLAILFPYKNPWSKIKMGAEFRALTTFKFSASALVIWRGSWSDGREVYARWVWQWCSGLWEAVYNSLKGEADGSVGILLGHLKCDRVCWDITDVCISRNLPCCRTGNPHYKYSFDHDRFDSKEVEGGAGWNSWRQNRGSFEWSGSKPLLFPDMILNKVFFVIPARKILKSH